MKKTPKEPPLLTLADVYHSDAQEVLIEFIGPSFFSRIKKKVLFREAYEFSGEWCQLKPDQGWQKMTDIKVYHIFPIVYKSPWDNVVKIQDEWEKFVIDKKPWWKFWR